MCKPSINNNRTQTFNFEESSSPILSFPHEKNKSTQKISQIFEKFQKILQGAEETMSSQWRPLEAGGHSGLSPLGGGQLGGECSTYSSLDGANSRNFVTKVNQISSNCFHKLFF